MKLPHCGHLTDLRAPPGSKGPQVPSEERLGSAWRPGRRSVLCLTRLPHLRSLHILFGNPVPTGPWTAPALPATSQGPQCPNSKEGFLPGKSPWERRLVRGTWAHLPGACSSPPAPLAWRCLVFMTVGLFASLGLHRLPPRSSPPRSSPARPVGGTHSSRDFRERREPSVSPSPQSGCCEQYGLLRAVPRMRPFLERSG